jgi:hypothetical protein
MIMRPMMISLMSLNRRSPPARKRNELQRRPLTAMWRCTTKIWNRLMEMKKSCIGKK